MKTIWTFFKRDARNIRASKGTLRIDSHEIKKFKYRFSDETAISSYYRAHQEQVDNDVNNGPYVETYERYFIPGFPTIINILEL